jgi:hypothetical protein
VSCDGSCTAECTFSSSCWDGDEVGSCANGCCEYDDGGGGGGDCVGGDEECDDEFGPYCCDGSCVDGTCGSYDPLLVDLKGVGFSLTNRQNGVKFDFFGNGKPKQIPWTAAESSTGWLVLDRNGNGLIDSGVEMFSNVAPQLDSNQRTKMGFLALSAYDLPGNGGNGDKVIDSKDLVFGKLRVWIDKNHDGISQSNELLTMGEAGVQSISLRYERANWSDVYGNQFRNRSAIVFAGIKSSRSIYDVNLGAASTQPKQLRRPSR